MPNRKKIHFSEKDVSHVSYKRPINVGETKTVRYMEELKSSTVGSEEISPYFAYGKIHFKKDAFAKGHGRAQKVFLKPVLGVTEESQMHRARGEVDLFKKMRVAGLPVPKAGVVVSRGQAYIAVEPFLRQGNSKSVLVPINTRHGYSTPVFLKTLNVKEHSELIKGLANDLATITNLDLSTQYFDIHGFYKKKDGTWTRVIMDTNHLMNWKTGPSAIKSVAAEINTVWRGRKFVAEKELFVSTLLKNLKDPVTKERFRVAFAQTSFWKLLQAKFM